MFVSSLDEHAALVFRLKGAGSIFLQNTGKHLPPLNFCMIKFVAVDSSGAGIATGYRLDNLVVRD
jgi:hypothetical protein